MFVVRSMIGSTFLYSHRNQHSYSVVLYPLISPLHPSAPPFLNLTKHLKLSLPLTALPSNSDSCISHHSHIPYLLINSFTQTFSLLTSMPQTSNFVTLSSLVTLHLPLRQKHCIFIAPSHKTGPSICFSLCSVTILNKFY